MKQWKNSFLSEAFRNVSFLVKLEVKSCNVLACKYKKMHKIFEGEFV